MCPEICSVSSYYDIILHSLVGEYNLLFINDITILLYLTMCPEIGSLVLLFHPIMT